MTEYTLIYAQRGVDVLVIRKKRPDWQEGLWNLPGGHMENGESIADCAKRELFEETGLAGSFFEIFGRITGPNYIVYVVGCSTTGNIKWDAVEQACWRKKDVLMQDKNLIPNLKIIIPLISLGVKEWIIEHDKNGLCTDGRWSF